MKKTKPVSNEVLARMMAKGFDGVNSVLKVMGKTMATLATKEHLAEVKQELSVEIAGVREDLTNEIVGVKQDLAEVSYNLTNRISVMQKDMVIVKQDVENITFHLDSFPYKLDVNALKARVGKLERKVGIAK